MSVLNFLKKVEAQVNPFDHGATASNLHPQPLAVQPTQQAPAPQGVLQAVQQQQAAVLSPAQALMNHLQQIGHPLVVGKSYMNNNPRMNPRTVPAMSYLNVRPGTAQRGNLQPPIEIVQGGHVQPQMPLYTHPTGQVQARTGQLQVQPSYLNIQQ